MFGEAVYLAARVQQLAGPNEVLITETTSCLVSGLFVMEERGSHELRGIPKRVALYRVLQPSGARGRLASDCGLTPFVGPGRASGAPALCRRASEHGESIPSSVLALLVVALMVSHPGQPAADAPVPAARGVRRSAPSPA